MASAVAPWYSSARHDWRTPRALFDDLHAEFDFTVDVCASAANACLPRYWTETDDALLRSWIGERAFMNPPYGRSASRWMEKAWTEAGHAAVIVCLVAARTDTEWWHEYAMRADDIRFVRGRLAFDDSGQRAPFPSVVLVYGSAARSPQP